MRPEVKAVCELLGFDSLYLANEGKVVVFVEKEYSKKVLTIMHQTEMAGAACVIGTVTANRLDRSCLKLR